MKVFNKIVDLQNQLFEDRKQGKEIGFVPTMGALHEGHASLVRRSVKENGITVVSVFVNPTQFNDKNDLKNYPRTLDADCRLLEATFDAGAYVQISGLLKRFVVKLSKICNDLRLMASGPRCGLHEINLPPMAPGVADSPQTG